MPAEISIIPILAAFTIALVYSILPGANPRFLFGVPVPEGFREDVAGRSILTRFHALNWTAALIGAVLSWSGFAYRTPFLLVAGPVVQTVAAMALFAHSRSQAETYAIEPRSSTRRAQLRPEPVLQWWGWVLMLAPVLMLCVTAAYLSSQWDLIPDRFPVHWGVDGKPNRWSAKTFRGVYGTLLIGFSTLVVIYGSAVMTALGAPMGGRAASKLVRAVVVALAVTGIFLAALLSFVAVQPLLTSVEQPLNPVWIMIPCAALVIGMILLLSRVAEEAQNEGLIAPEHGWWLSSLYYNRDDPAWMVPRRIGIGFTPNLGQPIVKFGFSFLLIQLFATIFYITR